MNKVTLIKTYRQTETLTLTDVGTLAENIIGMKFDRRNSLPRVCFASAMVNRHQRRQMLGYTGLVLLEVNNLTSTDEAVAIRKGCAQMPQTLLAFVGASGRSVKIVCRGVRIATDQLPEGDEVEPFHTALYEKARMAYNMQLGVTVEKLEPRLDRNCHVCNDCDAVYNPIAIPFYVDLSAPLIQNTGLQTYTTDADSDDHFWNVYRAFEFNLSKAYDEVTGIDDESNEYLHRLTSVLADQCMQTAIPIGEALRIVGCRLPFRKDMNLVRMIFENAYRSTEEKRQRGRMAKQDKLKNVPQETLLTWKVRRFLGEHYDLRRNVMRGVTEFRLRNGLGFDYQDLTSEARNSMTLRALEVGITCWDKDIRRYVESDDITPYDPIADFLEHLPQWDGRDRVTPLAHRVHTQYEDWPHLFHVWMRSMVAMWQGKGQLTGNALVPLLIGRQGCGKTSFCRMLLPRDLREYYNDRINFKNENDLNLGLTSLALINLDEFDSVTQRQQVVLKYLVSTSALNYRPPYGKAYLQRRRYASFIGTTNEQMPLNDLSGSRRFACVQVEGDIDFASPIDYPQLYAQLCAEIHQGERYWLTKDEEQALQEHNRQYMRLNGLGEMLLVCYRKPEGDEEGQWLSLKEIASRLKKVFGSGFREEPGVMERLGNFMNRADYKFDRRRKTSGVEYRVVER